MNEVIMNAHQAAAQVNEASRKLKEAKEFLIAYAKKQHEITMKVLVAKELTESYKWRAYSRKDWFKVEPTGYMNNGKYGAYPVIDVEMWERGYCGETDSVGGSFTLDELILLGKDDEFEASLMAQLESLSQKEACEKEERRQRQIKALEQQLEQLKG